MIKKFYLFEKYEDEPYDEEDEDIFEIGDRVIKNERIKPPFELDGNAVDVQWPAGRCFETIDQLKKIKENE